LETHFKEKEEYNGKKITSITLDLNPDIFDVKLTAFCFLSLSLFPAQFLI